ncbi:MAG: hypothetical protein GEU90_11670 [Gemmatimonas sp.]|nr:hypothetical protein [Gemmatimonas sp.]
MPSTRDQALAILGLDAASNVEPATIQRAFERLARRYPQPSFPERFRLLLEARDHLLDAGRGWRDQLTSRTLDVAWLLPHLASQQPSPPARRQALQDMLRAGYLAEPIPSAGPASLGAALERLLEP